MATRLYLPSSGTPPLSSLAVDSNWEQTTGLVRLPCAISKSNTALTDSARTWASGTTQQWAWWQFQSPQLQNGYSWTTADTISMVIRGLEGNAAVDSHVAYSVRVVSNDGSVVRGTIGLYHATSTEFTTSALTRIHSARTAGASNFSSQPGDRIIIEIGLHGVTPSTSYTATMRVGDPSATSDFALTAGLSTDLCPWVELSRDVVFGTPNFQLVVADCAHAHTVDGDAFSVTDDFEAYTTGSLTGQGNWVALITGGTGFTVADVSGDNRATLGSGEVGNKRTETFADDQYAEAVIDTGAASYIGIGVRISQGASDENGFFYYGGNDDSYVVYRVNGSETSLAGGNYALSQGDTIRIEVEGTELRVYRNGSLDTRQNGTGIYDVSSAVSSNPVLASGVAGIWGNYTDMALDNFEAGNIGGGLTLTEEEPSGDTLVVADASHSHSTDSIAVTQAHTLAVAESAHGQSTDAIAVTQAHTLVSAEASNAHSSEVPTLQVLSLLVVADASHAHSTDAVALTQAHDLTAAEASHTHSAEAVILTQVHILSVQDAAHAHATDSIDLHLQITLVVQDAAHSLTSDEPQLEQSNYLVLQDASHPHSTDDVVLTQAHTISVQDGSHSQAVESPVLTQAHTIVVTDTSHSQSTDSILLEQVHNLSIADTLHGHTAEEIELAVHSLLSVADGTLSHTTDAIELFSAQILVVADAAHSHTTDEIQLGLAGQLSVSGANHTHVADTPALTQAHTLVVQDTSNSHSADAVVIEVAVTLVVNDTAHSHSTDLIELSTAGQLDVADASHSHSVKEPLLTQVHTLSVQDSSHTTSSDSILLQSQHNLIVNDAIHSITSDEVLLTSSIELLLADAVHDHICDAVDIEQIRILTTEECVHLFFSDNVALIGGTSSFYTNFREVTPHRKQNEVVGGINANGEIYCRPCIELYNKSWSQFKLITRLHTYSHQYNCMICGWKLSTERNKIKIGG